MGEQVSKQSRQEKMSIQKQTKIERTGPFHHIPRIWKALLAVLAVVIIWLSLVPSVSVDVGPSLDSSDPSSFSFIVNNEGLLPLFAVVITCKFDDMIAENLNKIGGKITVERSGLVLNVGTMWPREKKTAPCFKFVRIGESTIVNGVVRIVITHQIVGIYKTAIIRSFAGFPSRDGKNTVWFPN